MYRSFGFSTVFCAIALLPAFACTLDAKLPEGKIRCATRTDCPSGWFCRTPSSASYGLCFRSEEGSGQESPNEDGGSDKGPDASSGGKDAGAREDAQTSVPEPLEDASVDAGTSDDASAPADASMSEPGNGLPKVTGVAFAKWRIVQGTMTQVSCFGSDPDSDPLTFGWTTTLGSFVDPAQRVATYKADAIGEATLTCTVTDNRMGRASDSKKMRIYPTGLLALFPFSGDSLDQSGNGRDAQLYGLFGSDDTGQPLTAALLDGQDDNITVSDESAFDLDAWSIVLTVRAGTLNNTATIFAKTSSGFGASTLLLYADNDPSLPRRLQYAQGSGANLYAVALGTYVAPTNKSFHLAITRSTSGQLRAYADGALIHSANGVPSPTPNDAPLVFGNGPLGAFAGTMDELQVYQRALDGDEVSRIQTMQ